ncbi:ATP-dependent DNA helicase RecG [Roseococcus sp. DSY-14]|uniref:ATP-dependent DNA helicase RecG n=1 Tax=Roseococcus sp. DSY-14 TaxID=3369650 RepID=UPI00387B62F5
MAPLAALPGVGPKRAALLAKAAGGERVLDLLFHLPERIAERLRVAHPAQAPAEAEAILRVTATAIRPAKSRLTNRRYVEVRTAEGVTIRILNGWLATVERQFPRGEARWVSGKVKPEGEGWSMANPEVAREAEDLPALEPIHRLTESLQRPVMAAAVRAALAQLPDGWPEWADPHLLARENWPPFPAALRALHAPAAPPGAGPRERLAYDEALAGQVALGLLRRRHRTSAGRALRGDGALRARALAAFGHEPTPDQHQALAEISADLAAPHRMLRLLQGDVGSGKTLVAVLAMLQAVEAGAQAALMAPTEILARQHARTLARLCGAAGVEVALLAGSVKGAERRRVLAGLADGSIAVAVGTHALFQEGVEFRDLGLAVVDEQHRFGVNQRLLLGAKGEGADMLVMTATPIPRTLQLTQWGEMQVSRIAGKPAGRQPIATRIATQARLPEVVARLGEALARGERAYWVVRAITGGEHDDSVAAEDRFRQLSERFPGQVGLAHGELDMEVREGALRDFAEGRTRLLVATTVIEVGVDVPEATIMLIEQAERFGLSALHQLRGRVGRGARPSSCLLVHSEHLSEKEKERLLILRDTEDGFVIAEADLRLRGAGEALGTRQAGQATLRLALPEEDAARQRDLIEIANTDAEALLHQDPALRGPRGEAVRLLLRLFGKDEAAAYLKAG